MNEQADRKSAFRKRLRAWLDSDEGKHAIEQAKADAEEAREESQRIATPDRDMLDEPVTI